MTKLTKAEQRERAVKIAEIARTEGWQYLRELMEVWAGSVQQEISSADGANPDAVLDKGYKYKYGTEALTWFVFKVEAIREELDKK